MSIIVESTSVPAVQASEPAVQVDGAAKSAPEAPVAAEQNEAATSDTATDEAESEADETDKDDAEAEGSDEESDAKESDKDKPRKKSGSQRRKERAERAEAEVERLRQVVEGMALKNAGEPKTEPKVEKHESADQAGKPNPETFETHAEYVEALTDWKIEEREKAVAQRAQQSQIQSEQETRMKDHAQRVDTFREKAPDFNDVIADLGDVQTSAAFEQIVVASKYGPDLLYALAKDPEEFERINKLPPLAAAHELGKLEGRLSADTTAPKQEPKKQTKAPAPINPVSSKGGSREKSITDPDLSQAEYERIRAKQLKASG